MLYHDLMGSSSGETRQNREEVTAKISLATTLSFSRRTRPSHINQNLWLTKKTLSAFSRDSAATKSQKVCPNHFTLQQLQVTNKMVSKAFIIDTTFRPVVDESSLLKKDHKPRRTYSLKRPRSGERSTKMKSIAAPLRLRRTKSMPTHLEENEYTGKPLFWFARRAVVPYQNLPARGGSNDATTTDDNGGSDRPPRPFIRILGKIRCQASYRSSDAAAAATLTGTTEYLMKPDGWNDSLGGTVLTISSSGGDHANEDDDDHSLTMVDYSDDEDESLYFDDASEDGGVLRGLSFLEEEREQ